MNPRQKPLIEWSAYWPISELARPLCCTPRTRTILALLSRIGSELDILNRQSARVRLTGMAEPYLSRFHAFEQRVRDSLTPGTPPNCGLAVRPIASENRPTVEV